jgi:hypothetical protein
MSNLHVISFSTNHEETSLMNHQFRSNPTTHHYPKIKGLWEIVSMINKYGHKRVTPLLNGGGVYGNTLLFCCSNSPTFDMCWAFMAGASPSPPTYHIHRGKPFGGRKVIASVRNNTTSSSYTYSTSFTRVWARASLAMERT